MNADLKKIFDDVHREVDPVIQARRIADSLTVNRVVKEKAVKEWTRSAKPAVAKLPPLPRVFEKERLTCCGLVYFRQRKIGSSKWSEKAFTHCRQCDKSLKWTGKPSPRTTRY